MKVFPKPNLDFDWRCPICGTNEEKEVVLVPIVGTQKGNNVEAEQFHLACLDAPWYHRDIKMLGLSQRCEYEARLGEKGE